MDSEKLDISKQIMEGATEIAFSIDTTGSMQPCIAQVRQQIEKTCEELFSEIPGLKIGLIAHGDYYDGGNCYMMQQLTDEKSKIFNFIRTAPNTSGGDEAECYELVLNQAKELGWSQGNGKVLVMIGDAYPHPPNEQPRGKNLEWEKELAALKEKGINVYALQCLYNQSRTPSNTFWTRLAELAATPLMKLESFVDSDQVLKGFAYAAAGPEKFDEYEAKVSTEALSDNVKGLNSILRAESRKYGK